MNKKIFKITILYGLITACIFNLPTQAMTKNSEPQVINKKLSSQNIGNLDKSTIQQYFEDLNIQITLEELSCVTAEQGFQEVNLDLSDNNLAAVVDTSNNENNCDFLVSLLKPLVLNKRLKSLDLSYNNLFLTNIYERLMALNPNLIIRMRIF